MRTIRQFQKDLKNYRNYIIYSGKSGLKAEIANSHLSWMWWILDPLLFMLVYSFIALVVFKKSEPYFPAFVFIGLSIWTFFERTVKGSVKIVRSNKDIVSKVYLPKYVLILVRMIMNGFKMLVSFSLVIVVMFIYRVPVTWNILYIVLCFLTIFFVTFGVSAFMLHFGVFVEDLFNVMNVALKLVFYMSGIFYSITRNIPEPYLSILLKLNPVALVIDDLRSVMLYSTGPHWVVELVWLAAGILLSYFGVYVIYKYENSYVKVI